MGNRAGHDYSGGIVCGNRLNVLIHTYGMHPCEIVSRMPSKDSLSRTPTSMQTYQVAYLVSKEV